jgi:hypothetical protein
MELLGVGRHSFAGEDAGRGIGLDPVSLGHLDKLGDRREVGNDRDTTGGAGG